MSKIRIYELAKELGTDNKTLETFVRGLGIEIKGVMSTLSSDEETRVRRDFKGDGEGEAKSAESSTSAGSTGTASPQQVIRRRASAPRPGESEVESASPSVTAAPASRAATASAPAIRPRGSIPANPEDIRTRTSQPVVGGPGIRPAPSGPGQMPAGQTPGGYAPGGSMRGPLPGQPGTPQARSVPPMQIQPGAMSQDPAMLRSRSQVPPHTIVPPQPTPTPMSVPVADETSAFERAASPAGRTALRHDDLPSAASSPSASSPEGLEAPGGPEARESRDVREASAAPASVGDATRPSIAVVNPAAIRDQGSDRSDNNPSGPSGQSGHDSSMSEVVTDPRSAGELAPNAAASKSKDESLAERRSDDVAVEVSAPGGSGALAERNEPTSPVSPVANPVPNPVVVRPAPSATPVAPRSNQPASRETTTARPVPPSSPVRPQKQPQSSTARPSGPSSSPSPASKPEIRRPAVEVGQRIELPKGTRRLPGGMAERLDQEQDQPVRRRPEDQRAAMGSPSDAARRHMVGDRPGGRPVDPREVGAQPMHAEAGRPMGGALPGRRHEPGQPSGVPVNIGNERGGPGAPLRNERGPRTEFRDDRNAPSSPGSLRGERVSERPAAERSDRGERPERIEARSERPGERPVERPSEREVVAPVDDRDGSVVRDASGVIVGAGRKKSEPKIVGFINIEPRKRQQQVIITEATAPSKQGRASARKQREEKVQQQGRRRTLATRGAPRREMPAGRGRLRGTTAEMSEAKKRVRVDEAIELSDLAHQMGVKASRVLRTLWQMGTRGVTINSAIDVETAELVATEFGYTVENVSFDEEELVDLPDEGEGTLRAPVVTVMGHVDHGKTTLLDRIRRANVAGGEAGGITQHVGAYRVDIEAGPIVFLDTPGHEAFMAMRERGASLTDILVLVVAADDGVMPTTIEAIKLAKSEDLPIVVALNKIDKPEANPAKVKRELMSEGVLGEEFGGDVPIVEISAKSGHNVEKLLELLALQAEVLDLRASDEGRAVGTVIEARIEKGRGVIATVLIEHGTLRRGDVMVAGEQSGRVRAMLTDRGEMVEEVGPSTPVEIFGLDGVPAGGEKFAVTESDKDARQLVAHRREIRRRKEGAKTGISALERMKRKKDLCLKVVLRADVAGSAEAVKRSIEELSNDKVRTEVISSGVGTINENDVKHAHAGEAVIIGFNTKPVGQTARMAESLDVDIYTFEIIYEAVDRIRELMIDLLPPEYREKPLGAAEVRALFPIPRLGLVCGCRVVRGSITRNAHVRVRRGEKLVHEGRLASLRVFKDDVKEVKEGFECGIAIEGFAEAQPGDVIEAFELEVIRPSM